jgi:hypothetical protein
MIVGAPEMEGAVGCIYYVPEPPTGSSGACDLATGQLGYTWPAGSAGEVECAPGFAKGSSFGVESCSIAVAPPAESEQDCAAQYADSSTLAYGWPGTSSPPEIAPAIGSAAACPGPWFVGFGMVTCMMGQVVIPDGGLLECDTNWVGFRPPSGVDHEGYAVCPAGFVGAWWEDGSPGCMSELRAPVAELSCSWDDQTGDLSVFWWP